MSFLAPAEIDIRKIVQSIRELWQGRSLATGQFTLAVSPATTTIVTAQNCGDGSIPLLTPLTLHAAAAFAAGTMYVSAVSRGQFVVTHASSAQTDRTFGYAALG